MKSKASKIKDHIHPMICKKDGPTIMSNNQQCSTKKETQGSKDCTNKEIPYKE